MVFADRLINAEMQCELLGMHVMFSRRVASHGSDLSRLGSPYFFILVSVSSECYLLRQQLDQAVEQHTLMRKEKELIENKAAKLVKESFESPRRKKLPFPNISNSIEMYYGVPKLLFEDHS